MLDEINEYFETQVVLWKQAAEEGKHELATKIAESLFEIGADFNFETKEWTLNVNLY